MLQWLEATEHVTPVERVRGRHGAGQGPHRRPAGDHRLLRRPAVTRTAMRDDTTPTFVNRAQFDNSAQARSGSGSAPRPSARASTPVGS
ncbi:DUF6192 family protein [Streptomyces canus]|uniref:DUF6192 family protein n=1 Tax=Streptomyces canus TaxID=58343 RepID=UPI0033B3250B